MVDILIEQNQSNFGITCIGDLHSNFVFNISKNLKKNKKFKIILKKNKNKKNWRIQSYITRGMRAQAKKQVDKCEIYLAISSFFYILS